jgi:DNA mismatch repair protein MutS2
MPSPIPSVLEFDAIRALVAREAATPMGAAAAAAIAPLGDPRAIGEALAAVGEMRQAIALAGAPPLHGAADLEAILGRAALAEASLEPEALLRVAATLEAAARARAYVDGLPGGLARLHGSAAGLRPMPGLVARIGEAIGPEAEIRDGASPALARLRAEARALRQEIRDRLTALVNDPALRGVITDPVVTIRNDRYVIPVRQHYRTALDGIVQDESGTGLTVFLEPLAVVAANNALRRLMRREEEEVRKILRDLTAEVRTRVPAIRETVGALGEIDLLAAKARLADRHAAHAPRVVAHGGLRLVQARHPLLLEREAGAEGGLVVPIDLAVGEGYRALVLTGPNTGGKTVALRTAGLLTLMALSGLPIPAGPDSQVPWYAHVAADIGDEQGIAQNLSTFSSHLARIVPTLERADGGWLVLLDELGAGTDPTEGGVLGVAILEGLIEREATVIVTTHLDVIKFAAHAHAQMQTASVAFDLDTLRPLYKLSLGIPGRSLALEIAAKLGMPAAVTARARELLGTRGAELAALLAGLEGDRAAAASARADAEEGWRAAAAARRDYERRLEEARAELTRLRRAGQDEIRRLATEARGELKRLFRDLRPLGRPGEERTARARIAELAGRMRADLDARLPLAPEGGAEPVASAEILPGRTVVIPHLGQRGRIVGDAGEGLVEVQLRLGKVKVPRGSLAAAAEGEPLAAGAAERPAIVAREGEAPAAELKVIGLRAEDAVARATRFLDDAFLAGLPRVRIVHGKGTGTLRKAIGDLLRAHPLVAAFGLADAREGGSGATVVTLQPRVGG